MTAEAVPVDTQSPLGALHYADFLAACESDAAANGGYVSVNRVRSALTINGQLQIEAHAFSGMWSAATGEGRPMFAVGWLTCQGSTSGNNGKQYYARKWRNQPRAGVFANRLERDGAQ